ncbi:MAG TPA: alpha-amylase family glycosyl hydrolase, partial [Thermoanaerobaculia bacterium]|nr:alpha-amylase family glycosyl hydrolase [Thermoanaerobaculia bacterium]
MTEKPAATVAAPTEEIPNVVPADAWQLGWARGSVFYEVFVRSFADSNGDGVGDLPGLISKLDYLNDGDPKSLGDLNVDALWLMPIFESPSYHGYDVTDYEKIQPAYGTAEDFAKLIAAAHQRGMKVILDLPINHTSTANAWFKESDASPTSAKRDWYVWRNDDPHWTTPWGNGNPTWHKGQHGFYYGVFWGGMPDLNLRTPAVRAEVERIAKVWLDRGVDGFRLDAARHLIENGGGDAQVDTPETHAFLKEFSAAVRKANPKALLVGENWTDAEHIAPYYGSATALGSQDELPMNFNFPLASAILASVKAGEPSAISAALDQKAKLYPKGVLDGTFLTNHDMIRIATELTNDPARLKLAAA